MSYPNKELEDKLVQLNFQYHMQNLIPYMKNMPSPIEGVNDMAKMLHTSGGYTQQERMIKDKRRSLDKATLYSYQGALIQKFIPYPDEVMEGEIERPPVRALINPNKISQDYDEKIVSVGYEFNFQPGDIFEWVGTNSYWLIYLQDLTELAYFRGKIRRCSYQISWEEDGKVTSTYAAVIGPKQEQLDQRVSHSITVDSPNYSLQLLLPNNEHTKSYFNRYSKFYLNNDKTCWRVEAIDWISTPGILEVHAKEYYANEQEDDINNGLVGALITKPLDPNPQDSVSLVHGEIFIKPKKIYEYIYLGTLPGKFYLGKDKKVPVEIKTFKNAGGQQCASLRWTTSYHGQFDLMYGTGTENDYKRTIVVESLF